MPIVAARGPSGKHNRLENMSHIDAGMIQLHCRISICYQANERTPFNQEILQNSLYEGLLCLKMANDYCTSGIRQTYRRNTLYVVYVDFKMIVSL